MELWYALVDLLPFDWAQPGSMYFMKNALLAVLVISPLFGVLSTMVVHSRMSFFSDALGHSAFTGMAIGAICGFNEPTWAAVLFAVVFALLFNLVRRRSALASDTVIGGVLLHRGGPGHLPLHPGGAPLPSSTACLSATSSRWSRRRLPCWRGSCWWCWSCGGCPSTS